MDIADNEGKACDAIVRIVEKRTGATRANVYRPEDQTDRVGPPVDLRLELGFHHYAIEHTRIEPFPNETLTGVNLVQLIAPVTDILCETLPKGSRYELCFPSSASLKANAAKLRKVQDDLILWVQNMAKDLIDSAQYGCGNGRSSRRQCNSVSGKPPGFPFEVTLVHTDLSGESDAVQVHFGGKRVAPENLEHLLEIVLKKALQGKCPKLQRCKLHGARTVLILEDNNIALTNHILVGNVLSDLVPERIDDAPDEIFLVETKSDLWCVWLMKCDSDCWPMETIVRQGPLIFQADELTNLTQ